MHQENIAKKNKYSEEQIKSIALDIASGIHFLHSQSPLLLHRNINLDSIYVGEDGVFKIGELGCCTFQVDPIVQISNEDVPFVEKEINKFIQPLNRPPELRLVCRENPITLKIDIWQLGRLLHILMFNKEPQIDELYKLEFQNHSLYSKSLINAVESCLKFHSKDRPLSDEFIQMISSTKILKILSTESSSNNRKKLYMSSTAGPINETSNFRSTINEISDKFWKLLLSNGTEFYK